MTGFARPSTPFLAFLISAAAICLLHVRAEENIRGSIVPDSDSLVYQNMALGEITAFQRGEYGAGRFFYGTSQDNTVPPLHKWSLQLGYLVFGVNNVSPYIVSAAWLFAVALGVFLAVRRITEDEALAMGAGFMMLAVPASLAYGFMESRNDWPGAALCLFGYYFFISSDTLADRPKALLGGLFAGLALLSKSSLPGYVMLPALYLVAWVALGSGPKARARKINLALSFGVALAVSGWFYAVKAGQIMEYYAFWSGENLADVKSQYHLANTLDELVFYPGNLLRQMGAVSLIVVLAGIVVLLFQSLRREIVSAAVKDNSFALSWAAVFAFSPYVILVARESYASPADINMLPFIVVLGFAGMSFLGEGWIAKRCLGPGLAALALIMSLAGVLEHNGQSIYRGIDQESTARRILALLKRNDYTSARIWSLNRDVYFDSAMIPHVIFRDPVLRGEFEISTADLPLAVKRGRVYRARERYEKIAALSDVLLVTNRPAGPGWISINAEWRTLREQVMADKRYLPLGGVEAYDDGTMVEVYAREKVLLSKEPDGWLKDGSIVKIIANPGRLILTIEGDAHGDSVGDLSLIGEDGGRVEGAPCAKSGSGRCFEFHLDVGKKKTVCRISSNTPLVPSDLGASGDRRRLLLLRARAFLSRGASWEG